MSDLFDTTPRPAFLRGLQNQKWTVPGAISELVDNSLGAGRGNASRVEISWNAKKRLLRIFDDGQGMDTAGRLFQLGNTIGRTAGDIGEYGSGGTMALIWLANRVIVSTLRGGQVSRIDMDWQQEMKSDRFSQVDVSWKPATLTNTPTRLLEASHGTMIELQLSAKRQVQESNVKRDLATTYAPTLRAGREVIWQNVATGHSQRLAEVEEYPDGISFEVVFEVDGTPLGARGLVAVVPDLTLSRSVMRVCFGHRQLFTTKDCYRSADGEHSYPGVGVTGYVDLEDGWQPYLTTAKNEIDDSRVREALMGFLFSKLEPLLVEAEANRYQVLLNDLSLELQKVFNGKVLVSVEEGGRLVADEDGTERLGSKRAGPETDHEPADPASRKDDAAIRLEIVDLPDKAIGGMLCRVDIQGNSLAGFVNRDHEYVKAALEQRPINRAMFYHMVTTAIASAVLEEPEILAQMFKGRPTVRRQIEQLEPRLRHGFLTRLLIDRVPPDWKTKDVA